MIKRLWEWLTRPAGLTPAENQLILAMYSDILL